MIECLDTWMHGSVLFYSMILNGRVGKLGKGSWSVEFNNSVSDYFGCKRFGIE